MSKAFISDFAFFPRPSLVRIAGLACPGSLFDLVVSVRFRASPHLRVQHLAIDFYFVYLYLFLVFSFVWLNTLVLSLWS